MLDEHSNHGAAIRFTAGEPFDLSDLNAPAKICKHYLYHSPRGLVGSKVL